MKNMQMFLLVICILNITSILAEYSRGDYETCYYSCRLSFKNSAAAADGDGVRNTYIKSMWEYE